MIEIEHDFSCKICNKTISEPNHLPCYCSICDIHLKDDTAKDGVIKCQECSKEFTVKDIGYNVNKHLKKYLEYLKYLSSDKKETLDLLNKFELLNNKIKHEKVQLELDCHGYFKEIKNQIDIKRE